MYATRKTYVRPWAHQSPEKRYSVTVTRGGKPTGIESEKINYVQEETMLWRKANHIHAWFVDNVQDGRDDCGSYDVSPDNLRALLDVCERVIEASDLVDGTVKIGTDLDKDHPNGSVRREPGQVIRDPSVAKELLPTRTGFFFGSDEYDEFYLASVQDTQAWVARMLAEHEDGAPVDIIYTSSW